MTFAEGHNVATTTRAFSVWKRKKKQTNISIFLGGVCFVVVVVVFTNLLRLAHGLTAYKRKKKRENK